MTLDPLKQKFYDLLPAVWLEATEAEATGNFLNIAARTARSYVIKFCEKRLLEKGKLGEYYKPSLPGLPSMPDLKLAYLARLALVYPL